jgi:hypothetical protein
MKKLIPEQNRRVSVPYKSRKNRRTIPANNVSVTSSTAATEKIGSNASAAKTVKSSVIYGNSAKTSSAAVPIQTHFLNELKWIGLVAVIIVILLLVAYYIFR